MADFEYQYAQVRVTRFTEREADPPGSDYTMGYDIGYRLAFDEAASVLAVFAHVTAYAAAEGDAPPDGSPLAELESENVFALLGLDTLRVPGEDGVVLPRMFVAQCIGIAFSTARGLLVGRARAPVFANAPLPVLNPAELLAQLPADDPPWLAAA